MKVRLVAAAVLAGALALSQSAHAATPTLDGKKVKSLVLTASGGAQTHDAEYVSLESTDRTQCAPDRCKKLEFVYKPARGVKGDLLFTVTWSNPASDMDLFVGEVAKNGTSTAIGSCGAAAGTQEKVFIPATELKPGKKYVLVMDFYRSLNETATGKVEIGAANTVKKSVPEDPVLALPGSLVNCGL